MCTAATYKTKDFLYGKRTLDYEFAYGEEVTVMPRNYPLHFRYMGICQNILQQSEWHMLLIIIHCIMMQSMSGAWNGRT